MGKMPPSRTEQKGKFAWGCMPRKGWKERELWSLRTDTRGGNSLVPLAQKPGKQNERYKKDICWRRDTEKALLGKNTDDIKGRDRKGYLLGSRSQKILQGKWTSAIKNRE